MQRSKLWLLTRHLLAAAVTVVLVMATWTVVTVPFFAVFLIDGEFTYTGYAKAVLWWAAWVSGATLAITPVAAGLERLVLRGGVAWAIAGALLPIGLLAAMAASVYVMLKYLLDSHFGYNAFALAVGLMFLLVIYWPALWLLNLAAYLLRRVVDRLRRPRSLPSAPDGELAQLPG